MLDKIFDLNKLLYTEINLTLDPESDPDQCVKYRIAFPKVPCGLGEINEMPSEGLDSALSCFKAMTLLLEREVGRRNSIKNPEIKKLNRYQLLIKSTK